MESHEKMKIIRQHRGLTQKEVAERMGTSVQNYSQYENGKRTPKLSTLEKIAAALDCAVADLSKDDILNSGTVFKSLNGTARFSALQVMFLKLNEEGQQKALDLLNILNMVPEYAREKAPSFRLTLDDHMHSFTVAADPDTLDDENKEIFKNQFI